MNLQGGPGAGNQTSQALAPRKPSTALDDSLHANHGYNGQTRENLGGAGAQQQRQAQPKPHMSANKPHQQAQPRPVQPAKRPTAIASDQIGGPPPKDLGKNPGGRAPLPVMTTTQGPTPSTGPLPTGMGGQKMAFNPAEVTTQMPQHPTGPPVVQGHKTATH